ncbi:MAG TPA: FlgD immunoglobulin-like domain containing protein [Candidatus Krumholzibacteria bacterium]|nr:FlgD immunoglobulin-like domain containing protein [Candidatus Krumholzibacteria bacterium]
MKRSPLSLVLALLGAFAFSNANAQWILNGRAPCAGISDEEHPAICSDGAGGAILAWYDGRRGADYDIFAARVSPTGNTIWCGPVCVAVGNQLNPVIVSNGTGGAVIAWEDQRNGGVDVYAQSVDAQGSVTWNTNGLALCTGTGAHQHLAIVSDGVGGAIVAWDDTRSGAQDLYCQRVFDNKKQWTTNGVVLCNAANIQAYPSLASDGAGGAIATWSDPRLGSLSSDIYAQRINAAGTMLWTANGIVVCGAGSTQAAPGIIPDGAGGGIIAWQDRRTGNDDIYAQRINSSGASQWTANGVALCTALFDQNLPSITSDGAGGAVVAWQDYRNGGFQDIYARRINSSGTPQWAANGVALCTQPDYQIQHAITGDGTGGAYVTWTDYRAPAPDIYARRVDGTGAVQWDADGVAVAQASGPQLYPVIVSGSSGDAIVAWPDPRTSNIDQVYAQRLSPANGEWGNPEPTITSIVDVPNDQGRAVTVRWHEGDKTSTFDWYEVWRNDNGTWNYINTVADNGGSNYSLTVPTLDDSTCWIPYGQQFQVRAWGEAWPDISNTIFASSHDNIPPPPPVLTMQRVGGTVTLQWTPSSAPDFNMYTVYMTPIPGQPGTANFDTAYNANYTATFGPPFADQYWSVAVWDSHCNRSSPSNEVAFLLPNTPVGNNVSAAPYDDSGSGTHPASVTFSNVTTEGRTSLNITPTGQSLPGTFSAGDGKYYNVTTTATVNGNVQVCIQYDENALTVPEASIRLLHYDTTQGLWQDITTIRDLANNVICGTTSHLSPFVIGSWGVTAVGDDHPLKFALHDAVPNPFNPQTTIRYDVVAGGADVNINIYDVSGRLVRELVNEHRAAGMWSAQWNGEDDRGQRVASGVYFYRMRAGAFVETKKMVLLK